MKAPMDEVDVVATPVPVRACVCARTCVSVCACMKRGRCTTYHTNVLTLRVFSSSISQDMPSNSRLTLQAGVLTAARPSGRAHWGGWKSPALAPPPAPPQPLQWPVGV